MQVKLYGFNYTFIINGNLRLSGDSASHFVHFHDAANSFRFFQNFDHLTGPEMYLKAAQSIDAFPLEIAETYHLTNRIHINICSITCTAAYGSQNCF